MELTIRMNELKLNKILEQSSMYTCACPAQVAREVINLRELYQYQMMCLERPNNIGTHELISAATIKAHEIMEQCLMDVLELEKWDTETMEMPEDLRQLLADEIKRG